MKKISFWLLYTSNLIHVYQSSQKFLRNTLKKMTLKPKQMHLMSGDLNIDHSKTNAKTSTFKIVLGGYDLNNMSLTGITREAINPQTKMV